MENPKSRIFSSSMPFTIQKTARPASVQQNAYCDFMSLTPNACTSSAYLNVNICGDGGKGGEGEYAETLQIHRADVELNAEILTAMSEHKLLKKRKSCHRYFEEESGRENKSFVRINHGKKQNHSEIEKRRRDKMNAYITELASMVPICHTNPRKLDKLTVLRLAVQHLRSIRGTVHSYTEGHNKPTFLSDEELKHLILQAADGFLFVVGCDRGRILFVSESVSQILNYSQSDLLGQSWFDILHPRDVAKVKEQLSSPNLSPKERLIDSKTMLPVKTDMFQGITRLCPGARRSFLCRMKHRGFGVQVKKERDASNDCHKSLKKEQNSDKTYTVIQCIGYLKSWPPAKLGLEEADGENDSEICNLSCLVAVGRLQSHPAAHHYLPFVSRHAIDGTFLFVDQRATLTLGFLPQELVGTNIYEYFHEEDIRILSEAHKLAMQSLQVTKTQSYRLRTKNGSYIRIQSEWRPFRNPWTKDIEYFISKNTVILSDTRDLENGADPEENFAQFFHNDAFATEKGMNSVQKAVDVNKNTHLGSQQMGMEVAQKKREVSPNVCLPFQLRDIDNESNVPVPSAETTISTGVINKENGSRFPLQRLNTEDVPGDASLKNASGNVRLSSSAGDSGISSASMLDMMNNTIMNQAAEESTTNEGNDEAAMAVIMSLLEADAGLGGPADFTGLPWPLS